MNYYIAVIDVMFDNAVRVLNLPPRSQADAIYHADRMNRAPACLGRYFVVPESELYYFTTCGSLGIPGFTGLPPK